MNAQEFASELHKSFSTRRREADLKVGAAEWSGFMFDILCRMARAQNLVPCGKGGGDHGGENRQSLWDFTMYDVWDQPEGDDVDAQSGLLTHWGLPCVVVEHENQHSESAFLNDFWKTLSTHAPLRVAIGYCGSRQNKKGDDLRESWVATINDKSARRPAGWNRAFIEGTEDLIALGFYGMTAADENFRFWIRSHKQWRWEEFTPPGNRSQGGTSR